MPINPDKSVQKLVAMPREMADAIADFRFEHRLRSEAEAIRRLIRAGLKAMHHEGGVTDDPRQD